LTNGTKVLVVCSDLRPKDLMGSLVESKNSDMTPYKMPLDDSVWPKK